MQKYLENAMELLNGRERLEKHLQNFQNLHQSYQPLQFKKNYSDGKFIPAEQIQVLDW